MSLTRAELLRRGFVAGVLLTFGGLAELAQADAAPELAHPGVLLSEPVGHWVNFGGIAELTWYGALGFTHYWALAGDAINDDNKLLAETAILNSNGSYAFGGLAC